MMRFKLFVLISVVSGTICFSAFGEEEDAAVQAFNKGSAHFNNQEYVEAAAAFREADALRPNWKILYNIGQSEAAAKRYGLSLEAFEAYLAQGGDDVPPDRRDFVLQEVERLRKMVGSIEVSAPDGALVLVDDVERGRTPLSGAVLIAAGIDHQLKVMKDDAILLEETVKVSGGAVREIDVKPSATADVKAESPESTPEKVIAQPETKTVESAPPKDTGSLIVGGWIAAGVGGALLIGGAITGGMALSLDSELDPLCSDGGCPPSKEADRNRLNHLATTTNVLIGTGAVFAVAGVVMVVVGKRRSRESETVALTPVLSPGLMGGTISWRF